MHFTFCTGIKRIQPPGQNAMDISQFIIFSICMALRMEVYTKTEVVSALTAT